jgi:hypothetical protein
VRLVIEPAHISARMCFMGMSRRWIYTLDLDGRGRHLEGFTQDGERLGGLHSLDRCPPLFEIFERFAYPLFFSAFLSLSVFARRKL